jgi:wyosine [tRNA(Phe)-imidazoG37] synthetase (radical SAM superfamily)
MIAQSVGCSLGCSHCQLGKTSEHSDGDERERVMYADSDLR